MKKQILIFLCLMLSVLPGCSNKAIFDFSNSVNIGKQFEEVLAEVESDGETLLESKSPGVFYLESTTQFHNATFSEYLMFNVTEPKTLYGTGYEYEFERVDGNVLELLDLIADDLTEHYGEVTTYPGLKNRIFDLIEDAEVEMGRYKEVWTPKAEEGSEIELLLEIFEDFSRIKIEYKQIGKR